MRLRAEYDALKQRRNQQVTKEFEKDYSRRSGVEGTISQAVGRFDLRQTRYYVYRVLNTEKISHQYWLVLHVISFEG